MPRAKCPACAAIVTYTAGTTPVCPSCGFAGRVAAPPTAAVPVTAWPTTPALSSPPPPAPAPHMPAGQQPPTQGIAIAALLLNILVWPGLGTLVASRVGEGLGQGFLFLFGWIVFALTGWLIITIPFALAIIAGAWIWGLVTGIRLLNESSAAQRAHVQA